MAVHAPIVQNLAMPLLGHRTGSLHVAPHYAAMGMGMGMGSHIHAPIPVGPMAVPGLLEGGDGRALVLALFGQPHQHMHPPQQTLLHLQASAVPDNTLAMLHGLHFRTARHPAGPFPLGLSQTQMAQAPPKAWASPARRPANKEDEDLGPIVDVRGLQRREHGRRISAFNFFVKEMVPQVRMQSPELVHQECMKRVAETWQGMSKEERAKWCFDPPVPKGKKKRKASPVASARTEFQEGSAMQTAMQAAPKVQKALPALPSLFQIISQGHVDTSHHKSKENGAGAGAGVGCGVGGHQPAHAGAGAGGVGGGGVG
jgi:hypothetical protein